MSNKEEKLFTERDVMSEHEDQVTGWSRYATIQLCVASCHRNTL